MNKNKIIKFLIQNGASKDTYLEKDGVYWWIVSKSLKMNENTMTANLKQHRIEEWENIYNRCLLRSRSRH